MTGFIIRLAKTSKLFVKIMCKCSKTLQTGPTYGKFVKGTIEK